MPVSGIRVTKEDGYVICHIDNFSDELKELIRAELTSICHGKNEVEENHLDRHSYKKTLTEFLLRYDGKQSETKKGMVGEFIAHLIINKVLPNLQTISIFFNKEELSIRKGFDLTYVDIEGNTVWYGEVKSGELGTVSTPDHKNTYLLGLAKVDVADKLSGVRPNLWNSVIIDAGLTFAIGKSKKVKELLDGDIREIQEVAGTKRNAILISVLFHDVQNQVTAQSVKDYLLSVYVEDRFSGVILFSIQKTTYSKIEDFLRQEAA
ncbi:MAG: Hachiman antiphage defense system protein HamA [Patescibacteria group bacterium]